MTDPAIVDAAAAFHEQVSIRLHSLDESARRGDLDPAIELLATCIGRGDVVHAFGTGHSEAFAMELAGRAGGLIPTNKIALRDALTQSPDELGSASPLERDPDVAARVWATVPRSPGDVVVIASNSGVNGSIVGVALLAKEAGHPVIAVTSLEHTQAVAPLHPSGKRLSEIADVVIDNLAPYGDATLDLGLGTPVGSVSSITGAYVAQLLTLGVALRLKASDVDPPLYRSANIPEGPEHNSALEARYAGRIRRNP